MSFQKTKTDPVLGLEVNQYLERLGLQTPIVLDKLEFDDKEKIKKIEYYAREILETLGLDLSDDSLAETPKRIAKMFVEEKFWGLKYENFPKCTTIENKMQYDEMIVEKGIRVLSDCEHHFVQIDGQAIVAYIPNKKVLGLSKLNRIVEYFSRRPQVQERLTQQIANALQFILETEDVAVVIKAKHYCVISRGVEDYNSETVTSFVGGAFKENSSLRSEFLSLVKNSL